MMRLSEPQYSCEQTLDECVAGITGNNALRHKLSSSKTNLRQAETQYLNATRVGELHTIPPINTDGNPDPVVINVLTKSELVKIYDTYFVPEDKPARRIYDTLMNSAKEECPYCGGIGTPRNLDHYLPIAHFPQFAVLPRNLVPACRDCNMDGKAHAFATRAEDQIIQPYADNDRFFFDQWVYARYHPGNGGEPGEFEYYVLPPEEWGEADKQRVKKHFDEFDLPKRYATKAAQLLGTVLQQIRSMTQAGLSVEVVANVLLQPGINSAPFINHWQRGMYQSLMYTFQNGLLN